MIAIIISLFSFSLLAQEPVVRVTQEPDKSSSKEIHKKLVELKNLRPEDFDKKIDDYRDSIEKYIEKKKRVCNGEFTTIILSDEKQSSTQNKQKLTSEEKQLCYNELKAIYKTYINHLFLVRRNFLEFLNKKRLSELAIIRDQTLKSIDSTFNRKQ